jgi:hypothetical protein
MGIEDNEMRPEFALGDIRKVRWHGAGPEAIYVRYDETKPIGSQAMEHHAPISPEEYEEFTAMGIPIEPRAAAAEPSDTIKP